MYDNGTEDEESDNEVVFEEEDEYVLKLEEVGI